MTIAKRLNSIRQTLPSGVSLVAVSKFHPAERIMEAYEAGHRIFGESRPQEMAAKAKELPTDIEWMMIGHLQTNKVKMIAPFVTMISSVDSARLVEEIERQAARCNRVIDILLEVHVAEEDSKSGWDIEELRSYIASGALDAMEHVRVRGVNNINKQQVHANVLGEHGDTSFVAWSTATIAGVPLNEFNNSIASVYNVPNEYKKEDVENYVRKSGGKIISRKGCTVYGIGMTSTHIVKSLSGSAETALTVSSLHEGEYGISDVCISSLSLIDRTGVRSIITQTLSDDELKKLYDSAEALKSVIRNVNF